MYLNCKTWFSYRYGTYRTTELVEQARQYGLDTLALTNINCTADAWDFVGDCRERGIRPVVGCEVRNGDTMCYLLLARDDDGLCAINRFLSVHLQEKKPFPDHPTFTEGNVWIIYPFARFNPAQLADHELIGVQTSDVNRLHVSGIRQYPHKFVVRHPVTFQDKSRYNLHRLLRAIDKNTLYTKLTTGDVASELETFLPPAALIQAFQQHPSIITRTMEVLASCRIDTELVTDKNKKHFTSSGNDDRDLLQKLALDGCTRRYGARHKVALERVKKELAIIDKMDFNAYFLIVWDILRYANERGFYHVGRGSGANSVVAYCLRITDVDPLKLDLYFERFMNPHRTSPPDFDIDFSWADRDAIIDYVFKRHGREHVALLGMYSTFQRKAILRELGKVFGLPSSEIDELVRQRRPSLKDDRIQRSILKYGAMLEDFPNHLSIHAGGMLISEKPIHSYCATELPPKGFQTSQLDMFVSEKVGLFKLDILSQRGLGHIKDAIVLIKENKQETIDIHQVEKFMSDPVLAEKIRNADTIGCFYIESPAMRQLLYKLRCDDYLTLVAASSIIRPGVAQSGMMRQYIERYHDKDKIVYLHPKMEELLKETYGVMVYQEDVIKVAHHFAGLELDEADILRRAMSGKYRSQNRFAAIKGKFFANCRNRGYDEQVIAEVWRQMESFGGYSFAKGHSASFAVESYQSLYLKTYYPMEFYVAVINNFGGFYRTEFYFHELKKTGANVHAPCINRSDYLTNIRQNHVYTGFIHIQRLEQELAHRIVDEREKNGPYLNLEDFIRRLRPGLEQLNILIRIDALRFTGHDKKTLLWKANFFQKKQEAIPAATALFEEPAVEFSLPDFQTTRLEHAMDQIELLGFTLSDPFSLLDERALTGTTPAGDLHLHVGRQVTVLGKLVTTKDVRTVKKEYMAFGTFLDRYGNWLDTVHFPDSLQNYPLQGSGFYKMTGKVVEEFGVYTVEVVWMRKVGLNKFP